jgi:2'-5' RNA ligase
MSRPDPNEHNMRAFIAIKVAGEIRRRIIEIQNELKDINADIRWVKSENIHITLKFLGEVEDNRIIEVCRIVEDAVKTTGTFELSVETSGVFPGQGLPVVIWIGVSEGMEFLVKLYHSLEESLYRAGFEKEKRNFSAHLTIGRISSARNIKNLLQKLETFKNVGLGRMAAEAVYILRSDLTPEGPVYSVIKKVELN